MPPEAPGLGAEHLRGQPPGQRMAVETIDCHFLLATA